MPKKTKIEKMELYKEYYDKLSQYEDKLEKVYKSKTVTNFSFDELNDIKEIYLEYYPSAQTNWNCGSCAFKMLTRMYRMYRDYEDNKS